MPDNTAPPLEGGCTCGATRYRIDVAPMIVHCCHCRWCQRETGSAFALNAMVETARAHLLQGAVERVGVPSASGKGQTIVRCANCAVALWSHYPGGGESIAFVRVGTLDAPDALPPDVHIFTASKQPWLTLPDAAPVYAEFYDPALVWSSTARERYRAAKAAAAV